MEIKDMKGLREKIFKKIVSGNQDECWKWDGAYVQGCATIFHEGKSHYVSRYIYMFTNDDFSVEQRKVRHVCRNISCCNPHHLILGAQRSKAAFDYEKLKRLYLKCVHVGLESECWKWIKRKTKNGYGHIMVHGKLYMGHRLAYMFHHPEFDISSKKLVFHTCKNKLCCNPKHLYLKDDIRGENNMNVKLTRWQVIEIRYLFFSEKVKKTKLAKMFNVSIPEILYILRGRSWGWWH